MKKRFALFLLGIGSLVALSVNASNLSQSQQPVCDPNCTPVPCDTVCPAQVPCAAPNQVPCNAPAQVPCDTVCPATPCNTPVPANPGCC